MKPHTTSLALVAVPASAARPSAAETAARVCGLALDSYPPRLVAQRLGCSTDLVTGWGRGKSSPSLAQVFASPERFALRLLALAGGVYASEVVEAPVRERLWCCTVALGRCLSLTAGRDLEQMTSEELERMRQGWADVHSESGKGLAEVDRELLRRAGVVKPGEDKGAR